MTETNSKENTKNKKLKNKKYMKKIICVVIILIGVSGFCFAQEVETEKVVKEKTYNKVVIGLNGGGSFDINAGLWDYDPSYMASIDIALGKKTVWRIGYESVDAGNNNFLGTGIRENIGKNIFIGAVAMIGATSFTYTHYWSGSQGVSSSILNNKVLGLRGSVFCEYKISNDIGIGIEPAYSYIPTFSHKQLIVAGGLRFYIK